MAKLLALGYPGGPIIDQLAKIRRPRAVKFPPAQIKHRQRGDKSPAPEGPQFDFSYSGIKTAVLRYVETQGLMPSIERRRAALADKKKPDAANVRALCDQPTLDLIAGFQRTMVEDLIGKTLAAAREYGIATLLVSGGVAANSEFRETFEARAAQEGLPVFFPSRPLAHRQRRHDRRRRLSQVPGRRLRPPGFFPRSVAAVALRHFGRQAGVLTPEGM